MSVAVVAGVIRLLTGVRARWLGCSPNSDQRVYFANHTSNLDAPVLWACLPHALRSQTRPVAAADYWQSNRLRRFLAHGVFHAVLIERKRAFLDRARRRVLELSAARGETDGH